MRTDGYYGGGQTISGRPWLHEHDVATLNVAGNRESNNRGLALRTERFLARVFDALGT